MKALDLFAGCGGASLGLHRAGYEVLGVEFDRQAHATHEAAGMDCLRADVRNLEPGLDRFDHLHASPPCQTFSTAGKGTGRDSVAALAAAVKDVLNGAQPADLDIDVADERTLLTLEPARWIAALKPATISLEQVRGVLPIWEAYAEGLRDLGYSAWAGLINAEQFGIPQNRIRAWLGARRDGIEARPPTPTHSRYYNRTPDKLDPGVAKWVSMADALDWGMTVRPSYTVTAGGTDTGGAEVFGNAARQGMNRAAEVGDWRNRWPWADTKPAPTDCGDPRLGAPGRHDPDKPGSQYGTGAAAKLTTAEALALQGFPTSWPLQGTRTAQFKQIGNAVPPHIARVVVEALTAADPVAWQPFLTPAEACHRYGVTDHELAVYLGDGLEWIPVPGRGPRIPTALADEFFAGKLRAVA
jgi:DNA (cytosine-5)-methyltransferase 1